MESTNIEVLADENLLKLERYRYMSSEECSAYINGFVESYNIMNVNEKIEDIEKISDKCCDKVGYYDVVGKVFQWLIDNDFKICGKLKDNLPIE